MNLVDTSVWVDHFRDADTNATASLDRLIRDPIEQLVMCEVVAMELLGGAHSEREHLRVQRLTESLWDLPIERMYDFRSAAHIFRNARFAGLTVRSMLDCLIAAIAIRHDARVVHKGADFERIARVAPLKTLDCR